jgi:ribonuclease BN (tRNA processing enzyme)
LYAGLMKYYLSVLVTLLSNICLIGYVDANPTHCPPSKGPTLQVLGSGGPIADDGRASTAYLIWIDGKSRFLVDAGGGVFLRFGEAGARFEDLDHIAISHFHTDHSTDLVALLKSGYFSKRTNPLSISGPATGGEYPGLNEYLKRLLSPNSGAYAYLDGYLDGSEGLVKLETSEIDTHQDEKSPVYSDPTGDIDIFALGVPHGPVPALAYRIRIGQKSVVFSGDQNGNSRAFIEFARGADILVMHMPVPENIGGTGRKLHAPPSIIGNIATETGASTLVLSHFMARSLYNVEENLKVIRSRYSGSLVSANDLDCINL